MEIDADKYRESFEDDDDDDEEEEEGVDEGRSIRPVAFPFGGSEGAGGSTGDTGSPIIFGAEGRAIDADANIGRKYVRRRVMAIAEITVADIASGVPVLLSMMSQPVPGFTYIAAKNMPRGFFRGKLVLNQMGNLETVCRVAIDTQRHSDEIPTPPDETEYPLPSGQNYIRIIPRQKSKLEKVIRHVPIMIGPVPGGTMKTIPYNFKCYGFHEGHGFNTYVTVRPKGDLGDVSGSARDVVMTVTLAGYIKR